MKPLSRTDLMISGHTSQNGGGIGSRHMESRARNSGSSIAWLRFKKHYALSAVLIGHVLDQKTIVTVTDTYDFFRLSEAARTFIGSLKQRLSIFNNRELLREISAA